MNAVDRPGTYKGTITEAAVTETKNGYPQFTGRFLAAEFYDEETQTWVPWAAYSQEILGFFVLYTKKDEKWVELLNAQQIKKALGWDGASFADLANGDYSQTIVMFRVEPREYNGNTTLNVTWIDAADANPTRQLQKYDATKLKELDGKFSGVLTGKTPKPVSAKPAGAVTPPKRVPGRPTNGPTTGTATQHTCATPASATTPTGSPSGVSDTPDAPSTENVPAQGIDVSGVPASSPAPRRGRPAGSRNAPQTVTSPSTSPPSAPASPAAPSAPKGCTKDEAWVAVSTNTLRTTETTDEKLAEAWLAEAAKIGKGEDDFTPADWATVRDAVVNETSKF
jgi:hypothetical protein